MKKTTKGALAAVAGGALLFGGAGSLAYWTGDSAVTGDTINSGTLTLGAPVCTVPAGGHGWELDGGAAFDPAADKVVPGDTLTKVCALDLAMTGNHIAAKLTVGSAAWAAVTGLSDELDVNAAFTVDGNPVVPTDVITGQGSHVVLATINVTFDGAAASNGSQGLAAALEDITVTATQTHA